MFIPDNLGEVEGKKSWLRPLETPIPTPPSFFPLPQNYSTFSLRDWKRQTPFTSYLTGIPKAKLGR